MGEAKRRAKGAAGELARVLGVETVGGRVQVSWDAKSAATPFGQLAFFIEFLTLTGLYPRWEANCPLEYLGPNGSPVKDILGTLFFGNSGGTQAPCPHHGDSRGRGDATAAGHGESGE
jgi:hypothetical protein